MFVAGAIGAEFIGAGLAGAAFGAGFPTGGGAEFPLPGLLAPAPEFGAAPSGVPGAGAFVSAGADVPIGAALGSGVAFWFGVAVASPVACIASMSLRLLEERL